MSGVKSSLDQDSRSRSTLDRSIATLVDVGGELGRLQVVCRAPVRMPLCADALKHSTEVQLELHIWSVRATDPGGHIYMFLR